MPSAFQQGSELAHDFFSGVSRQTRREFGLPRSPIEALDLISQDDTAYRQVGRKRHFKRVTLGMARNGTEKTEANFAVVRTRGHDNRWTTSGLLVPGLGVGVV